MYQTIKCIAIYNYISGVLTECAENQTEVQIIPSFISVFLLQGHKPWIPDLKSNLKEKERK